MALALAAAFVPLSWQPVAGQDDARTRAAAVGAATDVETTVVQLDALLAQLDARIADIRARAEDVLDLADAASDPRQQSRLEDMYGRMAAAAEGIEEQRSRLRALRNELAAAKPVSP